VRARVGGGEPHFLCAGDHPRGPDPLRPLLRALPQSGTRGPAGHRRGFPVGRADAVAWR
jgi:hypothetical protein